MASNEQTPAPPASSPVHPGDVVGDKYVVERILGVGGMGVVVAARHIHVQHQVALKFLVAELSHDAPALARFLREAQAVGAIRCEHVARVMDVGHLASGAPYLVMEYLNGNDLARLLEQGPLPEHVAISYIVQALVAVGEAHALGIVHRDLKPSNLFIAEQPDGSTIVKVLDFGISKMQLTPGPAGQSLTVTGSMLGSPLYMSPEQIRSAKLVDARSDIWSLGVILHEIVTGRPPFSGDQVSGVLAAIIADAPPSVRSFQSELSPAFEAVVLRCLSKDPNARFESAAELAQALAPIAGPDDQARIRRIVATTLRARGRATSDSSSNPALAFQAHSVVASPSSVVATAEGWAHAGARRDGRLLRRTVLTLFGVLALGGMWLWLRLSHTPAPAVAERHSAEPPSQEIAAVMPPKPPPDPNIPTLPVGAVVSPIPADSAKSQAGKPQKDVGRAKAPAHAKVKPPAVARPKPAGPRDPSELIDDRR